MRRDRLVTSERGAVLVQVAIALLGLIAISAFVIDYGVLWVSRRQAQNAADARRHGWRHLDGLRGHGGPGPGAPGRDGHRHRQRRLGRGPGHHGRRRHLPGVPAGLTRRRQQRCIRVDVFRNQRAGGNPLPTFFSRLVNITEQGVRATATAEVMFGDSTDCVKPFAIADKWMEIRQRPGRAGLERRGHVRALRPERLQRGPAARPGRLLRAAGHVWRRVSAQRHGVHPRLHGTGRVGSRPPHRPEGRQSEPGDRSRVVSPGRDQPDRRARRGQLSRQHRELRPDGDRTRVRARRRARQHGRSDQPGHPRPDRPRPRRALGSEPERRAGRHRRRLHGRGHLRAEPAVRCQSRCSTRTPTTPGAPVAASPSTWSRSWGSSSTRCKAMT